MANNEWYCERIRDRGSFCTDFTVSGGNLAKPTKMGWLITNEKGFTAAVSCDSSFVEFVKNASSREEDLRQALLHIQSIAGHPNAAEGCRLIVERARAALKTVEEM